MLACPCTGNIFIRSAHSLAGHSPSKEIGNHSWLELQIFRICRAWLTQHLLMSMANSYYSLRILGEKVVWYTSAFLLVLI